MSINWGYWSDFLRYGARRRIQEPHISSAFVFPFRGSVPSVNDTLCPGTSWTMPPVNAVR